MTIKLLHESEDEYHSRSKCGEMLSSHMLQLFTRSPRKYAMMIHGVVQFQDKPEYAVGRAAHKLILEGQDAFDLAYTVSDGPINERTNKPYGKDSQKYLEWLACQKGEIIGEADYAAIDEMNGACRAHLGIAELLDGVGEAEGVARATLEGVQCQIRMDWFSEKSGIVDLKTCRDIEFFEKDCRDFGYAYQLAFYQSVLAVATGVVFPVHIVAVDKSDFHFAGRWDIPQAVLDQCDAVNRAAIRRLKACRESGEWPTGFEHTRVFTLEK
jgi:hypothetical protein